MRYNVSEWLDSQKKASIDLHKLLQEPIDKANPRRTELTKKQDRLSKNVTILSHNF